MVSWVIKVCVPPFMERLAFATVSCCFGLRVVPLAAHQIRAITMSRVSTPDEPMVIDGMCDDVGNLYLPSLTSSPAWSRVFCVVVQPKEAGFFRADKVLF